MTFIPGKDVLTAFFDRIARRDGDLDDYLYDSSLEKISDDSGVDVDIIRAWLIANEYAREI